MRGPGLLRASQLPAGHSGSLSVSMTFWLLTSTVRSHCLLWLFPVGVFSIRAFLLRILGNRRSEMTSRFEASIGSPDGWWVAGMLC